MRPAFAAAVLNASCHGCSGLYAAVSCTAAVLTDGSAGILTEAGADVSSGPATMAAVVAAQIPALVWRRTAESIENDSLFAN